MRWIPTYFLTIAMAAFGTVTQGDDDAWFSSLFLFAPIAAVAIIWIILKPAKNKRWTWLASGHLLTFFMSMAVLPGYWIRVTFAQDHIGAGFSTDYIRAFEPAPWHAYWAPTMSFLFAALVVAIVRSLTINKPNKAVEATPLRSVPHL